MFGILNINKPVGLTSRDVVTQVVQAIRQVTGKKTKAGHAGTLDPIASGVLVVCLGQATRLIQYVQRSPKTYQGRFQLDVTSDSADTETTVESLPNPARPTRKQLEDRLPDFVGTILQQPPAFSAISIDGQKAYKLARKGVEFDIEHKQVEIKRLEIFSYQYPTLELLVECGTGTYIRSLGRDLARAVNSDAVMLDLKRTAIGSFTIERAIESDELTYDNIESNLINPLEALDELPRVQLNQTQQELLANGRFVDPSDLGFSGKELPPEVAATDGQERLVAILEPRDGEYKSKLNLPDR